MSWPRLLVLGLVLGLALLPRAGADAAAPEPLGLSWDGRVWTSSLSGALFDPQHRWVPGESGNRDFWLRNESGQSARLRVHLAVVEDGLEVPADLVVSVRAGGGAWQPVPARADGVWLPAQRLAAGEERGYRVRAEFRAASTTERAAAQLDVRAVLIGTESDLLDDDDDLPHVGSSVSRGTLVVAVLGLGLGLALLRRRRTRDAR